MALHGKWNEGLSPTMPLAEAARLILTGRLEALLKWWEQAELAALETEPIHNLRVASRRAAVALDAFAGLIPRRTGRSLQRQCRRLRRQSGEVRDRDVFLIEIGRWMTSRGAAEQPGCDYLAGIWSHWRHKAFQRLMPELRRHERFAEAAAALQLRGGRKRTLRDAAADILPDALAEFDAAAADDVDGLHALRIHAKRLRYTIELFAVCFPPGPAEGAYSHLEELQDVLGAAHDAEVNAALVQQVLEAVGEERYRPGISAWLETLTTAEAAAPKRLVPWLEQWHAAAPALSQFA